MEHQAEVADFLRMCRNRITPERAGIIGGGHRRVPGLRREEVAERGRVADSRLFHEQRVRVYQEAYS